MNKEEFAKLIQDYGNQCGQVMLEAETGTPRAYGRALKDQEEAWADVMKGLEDYINLTRRAAWEEGARDQYAVSGDYYTDIPLADDPQKNPYREDES